MLTIHRTLEEKSVEADRVYLANNDIYQLERFAKGFSLRVKTYNLLRDHADEIVLRSLKLLAHQYPALLQKQAARCKYDMSNVLRYISASILRDDELFFQDQMMDWLSTILYSYQVLQECSVAYHLMQEVVDKMLPAESAALVKPYTDKVATLLHRD
ncbi:MAG: phycocyanin [Pseudanabaenaceae cyanobacterium]|jgi:hypothetical protein